MFGIRQHGGQRAIQATPWGEWLGEGGAATWAGPRVDTSAAVQQLTVYGCNRFICEGISTLPIDVFRRTDEGRAEVPHPPWVDQPTVDLDPIAWRTQVLTSLLLDGNAYLRKVFDGTFLIELVPLDPSAVVPYRERGRKRYRVNGVETDGYEILHIPAVMRPGAEVGMSPVEAARQEIGLGMSAQEFGAKFYSQGANLGGVIEVPGELPPEKAKELAQAWARRHSGNRRAHLPGVLEGGAQWKVTGVSGEQMQFLQTRQFSAAQIAALMFLIDPTEFGISMDKGSSITYANLEQRNARKLSVTFLPWIVRIELMLSSLLQKPRYVKFNVDGLLRGDLQARYESYAIGITNGFLGADEAREFEDLPPRNDLKPAAQPVAPADDGQNSLRLLEGNA